MFFQFPNEVLLDDVRIPLSCSDRRVSEKLLNHPDIHAVSEQERGDCVAQHVRSYVSFDTRVSLELGNNVRDALS